MNVVYLANNYLGWRVARQLKAFGDFVVALGVHSDDNAKYREQIVDTLKVPADRIIVGDAINDPAVHEKIRGWAPDVILSVLFDTILTPETLRLPPRGAVNLHNSYLPYNRGNYANVWSIVNHTPAGATLHVMDAGIDTGPILDRIEVPVDIADTGETLYHKIEKSAEALFVRAWPKFTAGQLDPIEQKAESPTPTHNKRDVEKIDRIDPDATVRAGDLIDTVRARTFKPYKGAYMQVGDRKVYLRLELLNEDQL